MANAFLLKPLVPVAITRNPYNPELLGAPPYLLNDYAGVIWRGSLDVNGDTYLRLDLGADTAIDTIMLFGLVGDTAGTMQVALATAAQGPFTGAYYAAPVQSLYAGTVIPTSGRGVALWMAPSGAPTAARYVSIGFDFSTSATSLELARLVVGKRFQPSRNFSYGAGFGVKDLGSLDFSRRGVPLRTRGAKLRTRSIEFASLRKDEVETAFLPLLEYLGNTETFALCTDPTDDAQRQNRCSFGWHVGDVGVKWRNGPGWTGGINQVATL